MTCLAVSSAMTLTYSFYAASCSLFISFAEDISNDVSFLIVGSQTKQSHRKIKDRFCKIVKHYSIAKQLSPESNSKLTKSELMFM